MSKKIVKRELSKIYIPKKSVVPLYQNNVITQNFTNDEGNIINKSAQNAVDAREFSKENKL